jgi:DNA excision repair protein ERCC-3
MRKAGPAWSMRTYQEQASAAFLAGPDTGGEGGSGVVVLPCGAGKTIVGISAIVRLGMRTLILCTNVTALRQWRDEILDKTTLTEDEVGEYSGERKEVKPITLTTYQMLTWRKSKQDTFQNMALFDLEKWGLIVYDEVHLLPAPVFRSVAQLQARRRLGLTATLVREDGHEGDVFALIGPKRFDVPWRDLEHQGWIATARCSEIRVELPEKDRFIYSIADDKEKFRLAATNPRKMDVVESLLARHPGARVLILGMYLDQLHEMSDRIGVPLITGDTRQKARDELYGKFRTGEVPVMVISRVGNFSVDLPDANVAIQISGTWGSRQEEAQRLGRVLRPKSDGNVAWFYSIVSRDTTEQEFAEKRQLFLTEQGYAYEIEVVA